VRYGVWQIAGKTCDPSQRLGGTLPSPLAASARAFRDKRLPPSDRTKSGRNNSDGCSLWGLRPSRLLQALLTGGQQSSRHVASRCASTFNSSESYSSDSLRVVAVPRQSYYRPTSEAETPERSGNVTTTHVLMLSLVSWTVGAVYRTREHDTPPLPTVLLAYMGAATTRPRLQC
jgi:hypothetical protein